MKTYLLQTLLVFGLILVSQQGNSQCVVDENRIYVFEANGHSYELVKESLNWVNAAACAASRGGKLVEINSNSEQAAVFGAMNTAGINGDNTIAPDGGAAAYLWLGGNDLAVEGNWIWDGNNNEEAIPFWVGIYDGTAVDNAYVNWGNEPDNFGNQDALGIAFTNWPLGVAGQWNDIKASNTLYYIIEYNTPNLTNDRDLKRQVKITPNPSFGQLTIKIPQEAYVSNQLVKIYNTSGVLVEQIKVDNAIMDINLEKLPNGMYFIQLEQQNTLVYRTKIILIK